MKPETTKAGDRHGRLIAIRRDGTDPHSGPIWVWGCDCGTEKRIRSVSVRKGVAKSCGCFQREARHLNGRTHGHTAGGVTSPTLHSYRSMMLRCHTPTVKSYKRYGAVGIIVCARWQERFENFLEDMGERPKATTLDRIRNFGNYEPGNCRWANRRTQASNRSCVTQIRHDGVETNLKDWARRSGVPYMRLYVQVVKLKRPVGPAIWFVQEQMRLHEEYARRISDDTAEATVEATCSVR